MDGTSAAQYIVCAIETPLERAQCFRLRYEVYVGEQRKDYQADHERGELCDALDDGSTLLAALSADGVVLGTVRVTSCDHPRFSPTLATHLQLDAISRGNRRAVTFTSRLAIARSARHTPVFRDLVCEAYRVGAPAHVSVSVMTCRRRLLPIFEHLGYRPYGDEFVDDAAGPQQPMMLVVRDLDHLRAAGSPFLDLASQLSRHAAPCRVEDVLPSRPNESAR